MAVEFNSSASLGLNTGAPDFGILLEKITAKELVRLQPNQELKEKYKISFNAWQEAKGLLEGVKLAAEPFLDRVTFNSKVAESSDPEIVTASADITAVPGVYQIVVDKIALYNQVGSQRYIAKDSVIGQGQFHIGLVDDRPLSITIDASNNTLQGLMDAINNAKIDISANIVKLDNSDAPYQLVLTSKTSGSQGRIVADNDLSGGEAPLFKHRYNQPTKWYYAPRVGDRYDQEVTPGGASSAVPIFSGDYSGDSDITITFTALNSGRIGASENLALAWKDTEGRSGVIKLGKYDYDPGTPIDIVDGIQLTFQGGELIINDSFTVEAHDENFNLFEPNTPPTIDQPSTWQQQTAASGSPIVQGVYTADDDDRYYLTVKKSGVIGVTEDLIIDYESDNGQKGSLNFGLGYQPGTELSIGNGLTLAMQNGALQADYKSQFDVEPNISSDYWWLFDDGTSSDKPPLFSMPLTWDGENISNIDEGDLYDPKSKKSNAKKELSGDYRLDEDKRYKFTVKGDGRVGTSAGIYLEWDDNKGNTGILEVGSGYQPGSPLKVEGGLFLNLFDGYIFDGDYFYADAFSPTIQPAQDAEVRIGVTETGQGGMKVISPTNDVKNAIQGVTLHLHRAEDKVVTITIGEDKEKVKEAIKAFVEAYNKALVYMKEALKYDPETQIAGPLQAENTLSLIQDELREILVDAIPGLPKDANTLPYAGITIDKEALIVFDEQLLDERLAADYDKVANLFRSYGSSNNSGIVYVNSRTQTTPSGEDGYLVDITQAASRGYFQSDIINAPIIISPDNNQYVVAIDGRETSPITIESGAWSLKQIAKEIGRQVKKDPAFTNIPFNSQVEKDRLLISSETFGSRSSATIRSLNTTTPLPFAVGEAIAGRDVQGTINGNQARGSGRLLVGGENHPESDLQLIVTLTDAQITAQPEANVVFTVGKGGIVEKYLDAQLKKNTGPVDTTIKNVGDRIKSIEDRLASQEARIERKRERLVRQFSRAESRISELKAQQTEIANQGLFTPGL